MQSTSAMRRRPIVGVMGSGSDEQTDLAEPLGHLLARLQVHLLTGGGRGVMNAVSRAFARTPDRDGSVIGIIPCREDDPRSPRSGYPNEWVEIPHPHTPPVQRS